MNDTLFAQELAAVLASSAYPELFAAVPQIHAAQAGANTGRPSLTISGEWEPYLAARKGLLVLELRSRSGDEGATEPNHISRFSALFAAFMGAQGADRTATFDNQVAAKVALKAALADRGKVELIEYGLARPAVEADTEEADLRTIFRLNCAWRFLPV